MDNMAGAGTHTPVISARDAGLVACTRCTRVWPAGQERCGRCGSGLRSRDITSLQRVWGWWIAGLIAYIPANLYPMLNTRTLLSTHQSTIVGGAVELFEMGSYGVAFVILFASVAIPIGKFMAVAFLAISVRGARRHSDHQRHRLYELVEFIGRWSMIDVFVVAILSALVHLGSLVEISPGPAAVTFALSVVFTMLSAQSFDSRMIFDQTGHSE